MKVIGITGSFGTGKTTVASMFKSLGAEVFDADVIAHAMIKKGKPAYEKIVRIFGGNILTRDGEIDRKKLASEVFGNRSYVRRLNAIIHPEVIGYIKNGIKRSRKGVLIIDAPLLVEANLMRLIDKLIVVRASRKAQISRCTKKFAISKADVRLRIGHQIPIEEKIRLADFVIDNSGTRSRTRYQIKKVWEEIWK